MQDPHLADNLHVEHFRYVYNEYVDVSWTDVCRESSVGFDSSGSGPYLFGSLSGILNVQCTVHLDGAHHLDHTHT